MSVAVPLDIRYRWIKVIASSSSSSSSSSSITDGYFTEESKFVKTDGIWRVNVIWSEMNTLPFPWAYAVTKTKDIALTDLALSGIDVVSLLQKIDADAN